MTFLKIIISIILLTYNNASSSSSPNSPCSLLTENTRPCCEAMEDAKEIMSIIKAPQSWKDKSFSDEFRIVLQLIGAIYYKKYSMKIQFHRNINLNNRSLQNSNSLQDILYYFQYTGYCLDVKIRFDRSMLLFNPHINILECIRNIKFKTIKEYEYFNDFENILSGYKVNILMYKKQITERIITTRGNIIALRSSKIVILNLLLVELYLETEWFKSYKAYFTNSKNEIEIHSIVLPKNEDIERVYINHFHYKWFFIK
eukprot:GAHX01001693.1.p1 GENE.GAHX01001693.1~~GAHX01001693.1.p1  ORF type:complete len:257 (-),score=35.49 GAHX01001693.1:29-799(-)